MPERKAFGMTMSEMSAVREEVEAWHDINHPYIETESGDDSFRIAFSEGSQILCNNEKASALFAPSKKFSE